MNNNSIEIDNYLQNKMSAVERIVFEKQLAADPALQYELQVQQQVIMAAEYAGLKLEFAKAIRKRTLIKRCITWGTIIVIVVTTLVVYNFRDSLFSANITNQQLDSGRVQQGNNDHQPFVDPPLPAINVPFSVFNFEAEKGDTIFYGSGSVICFPPDALVDGSGNIVKGNVKIMYREFTDPVDFFVSGIPMQYDSVGKKYNFESSGMCEINAYKDDKPVFVNPQAKPQIHLSSKNKSALHNVYFLDTVTRGWHYRGKDMITEVKNTVRRKAVPAATAPVENVNNATIVNDYEALPLKPVKPMLANDDHQAFSIEIDPGSFEELFAYDRLKFEVVDEKTYRRSDANEHWDNVKLERTDVPGIYNITFANAARKVSYKVRPVLEGADYDAALKVFTEKNKAYEEALKHRLVRYQMDVDSADLTTKKLQNDWKADSAWNAKMNALILERNKNMRLLRQQKMEEMKKQAQEDEKRAADQVKQMQDYEKMIAGQLILIERNRPKYELDMRLSSEIIRSFTINNFGVWNCDHPQYPSSEVPLNVTYTDSTNNSISLHTVSVVYKGFNGITQFPGATMIRVIPGSENMIWSVNDSWLYYFTYKDFMQTGISKQSRSFTFKMRRSKQQVTSYNEIRQLLDQF